MAIGSEAEIGAVFAMWKDMSTSDRQAWWQYMRDNWNPLMKGYATLVHHKDNKFYKGEKANNV